MYESGHHYEQRRFSRVLVGQPCTFTTAEGETVHAEIGDASMSGLRLVAKAVPPVATPCTVRILPEKNKEIEVKGTVVAIHKDGFAIEFHAIRADGFEHFRDLLVNSAEDGSVLDQEIMDMTHGLPDMY